MLYRSFPASSSLDEYWSVSGSCLSDSILIPFLLLRLTPLSNSSTSLSRLYHLLHLLTLPLPLPQSLSSSPPISALSPSHPLILLPSSPYPARITSCENCQTDELIHSHIHTYIDRTWFSTSSGLPGSENAAQDGALHVHTDVSPVLAQVFTDKFDVYSAKRFPGVPGESLSFFESRPFLLVFVLLGPAYFGWCL